MLRGTVNAKDDLRKVNMITWMNSRTDVCVTHAEFSRHLSSPTVSSTIVTFCLFSLFPPLLDGVGCKAHEHCPKHGHYLLVTQKSKFGRGRGSQRDG